MSQIEQFHSFDGFMHEDADPALTMASGIVMNLVDYAQGRKSSWSADFVTLDPLHMRSWYLLHRMLRLTPDKSKFGALQKPEGCEERLYTPLLSLVIDKFIIMQQWAELSTDSDKLVEPLVRLTHISLRLPEELSQPVMQIEPPLSQPKNKIYDAEDNPVLKSMHSIFEDMVAEVADIRYSDSI